jgi:type III secretion system YseE family protein
MTRITDLEEVLHEDCEGPWRDRYLEQLRECERELRAQLRLPQIPERYASLLRAVQATSSAQHVIETLWRRYHGDEPSSLRCSVRK